MIVYLLTGVIVLEAVLFHFERKDLYNRVQGKTKITKDGKWIPSAHERKLSNWRRRDGDNE